MFCIVVFLLNFLRCEVVALKVPNVQIGLGIAFAKLGQKIVCLFEKPKQLSAVKTGHWTLFVESEVALIN